MDHDVLIVGAGQGGAQAAISLRQGGFAGSIGVIGEQPDLPYELPPLSKDYLAGEKTAERLLLRPAAFWTERQVDFHLGQRIDRVDADKHAVFTEDGARFGYRHLIWATGGAPRPLPVEGGDLPNVHGIRTRADVDRLKRDVEGAARVTIVGGGYIGLEAAAVLSKLGKTVTVLESLDRVLARVTCETVSRFYEAEHRAHGVEVRLGASVQQLVEVDGRAASIQGCDDLRCDAVIVGIGILPAVGPLALAGAETGNGVHVDDLCRTTLPDVFAIGDCANHANAFAGGARIRLESVQNAIDMAKTAAGVILGEPKPYHAVPWFWSNQYDLKLQTVGLSGGFDATVVRGDPASRAFSVVYLKDGGVIALDCINTARDFVQGKALIERRLAADPAALADANTPLKSLLRRNSLPTPVVAGAGLAQ